MPGRGTAIAFVLLCAACGHTASPPPPEPTPSAPGPAPAPVAAGSVVMVSATSLSFEGQALAMPADGPELLIEELATAATAHPGDRLVIQAADDTPFALLPRILYSTKDAFAHIALRIGDELVELWIPRAVTAVTGDDVHGPGGARDDEPLQVIMTIRGDVTLSPLGGGDAVTIALDDTTTLADTLAAWASGHEHRSVIVTADASITAGVALPLIAAAHRSFPEVVLSTGFY